jgi:hypothetical protein
MSDVHSSSELDADHLQQTVSRCAVAAVDAAATLLENGGTLEDLVAIMTDNDQEATLFVGPVSELLAQAPDVMLYLELHRDRIPPGYLPWVAFVGASIAWGAFSVVPIAKVDA